MGLLSLDYQQEVINLYQIYFRHSELLGTFVANFENIYGNVL